MSARCWRIALDVVLARSVGFCFGVQRAVQMIEQAVTGSGLTGDHAAAGRSTAPIYLLGKLVHNRQAVDRLEAMGARLVSAVDEVPAGATAVVSTHGAGPGLRLEAERRGITLMDATCPFVRRIHRAVERMSREGFAIFVFGDAGHKEVQGIVAWAGGKATVVESAGEVLTSARKIGLVAQTTQNLDVYRRIVSEVASRHLGHILELRVADTICDATEQRQSAAVDLAHQVDVMVVVGGADSANTRRLGELCRQVGVPTHLVEEAGQLIPAWFAGKQRVGVTAGASTPAWVIDAVVARVKELRDPPGSGSETE